MQLQEFYAELRENIRSEAATQLSDPDQPYPQEEKIFSQLVMDQMAESGMTEDPTSCFYAAVLGRARLKLTGYSISSDTTELDLFVSLYQGHDQPAAIPDSETKDAAQKCVQFLSKCAERKLVPTLDPASDVYPLALVIQDSYSQLDQIRIFVLTDGIAKSKQFKPREVEGKAVHLEVMDIERLFNQQSAGKPRDELVADFTASGGKPLPCVYVPGTRVDYDYILTAFPGETLRSLYEMYGSRLIEANVRSFLSDQVKVNRGIRDTLRNQPEHFLAFNNGIVIVADAAHVEGGAQGYTGLASLKGLQIVNGGQTTASIYFAKRKNPEINLDQVRVPAKIIVLRRTNSGQVEAEEEFVANISKYSNSQTAVKLSDLSANKQFHVEFEKLAATTICSDGTSRWFYERAAGSYKVLLAREGTTPARLRNLKANVPASRKISKTDLAKYINAWDERPDLVSLGAQKNFDKFQDRLEEEPQFQPQAIDVTWYKHAIAKAIIFKFASKMAKTRYRQAQANIAAYLVSVLSHQVGSRINLDRIWQRQALSEQLQQQLTKWGDEIDTLFANNSGGRQLTEQAKRADMWAIVRNGTSTNVQANIPELS